MTVEDAEWVRNRSRIELSNATIEQHTSIPNALEFSGCDRHLLCLLLSDGNQQKITQIENQRSEKAQQKGSFWICPAKSSGTWVWDSTDRSLMLAIDPSFLQQTAVEICDTSVGEIELLSIIDAIDPQISAIAYLFQTELATSGMDRQLYADSLMQVLAVHLIRHYCTSNPQENNLDSLSAYQFRNVLDYIHSHLNQPLGLTQLAEVAGMSQYYFCRRFKQVIGVPPYQYLIQQRIEQAKILLRQRKCTIAEIAIQVGFSDQSRFSRHFKKHVGVVPSLFLDR